MKYKNIKNVDVINVNRGAVVVVNIIKVHIYKVMEEGM